MTSTFTQAALFMSRWFELSLVVKATILVGLGLIVALLTKRSRASLRHLIFVATFASVSILPFIQFIKPAVRIKIFSPSVSTQPLDGALPSELFGLPTADARVPPTYKVGHNSVTSSWLWLRVIDLIWFAGIIAFVVPLAIDARRVSQFRRVGLPWLEQRERIRITAKQLGIKRPVEILLHERIVAPFTCGVRRPVLLLPTDARDWSSADLQRSFIHELEHIRRNDWATQWAARIICAFYWFNPLIWIVWRNLCLEAERACDDAAIEKAEAADRAEYATQLVTLARRMSAASSRPVLGLANRSDLSQRVSSLLERTQRRGPVALRAIASCLIVTVFFTLALASLQLVAQPSVPPSPQSMGGLPLFPGAQPSPEAHRGSLDLERVAVRQAQAAKYESDAAVPDITAFYRQSLQRLGSVYECADGRNVRASVHLDSESLADPRVCRATDLGQGETELKVGAGDDLWLVTFRPVTSGSEFTLVHIRKEESAQSSGK